MGQDTTQQQQEDESKNEWIQSVAMIDCSDRDVSPWVRRWGAVVSKVVHLRVGVAGLDEHFDALRSAGGLCCFDLIFRSAEVGRGKSYPTKTG